MLHPSIKNLYVAGFVSDSDCLMIEVSGLIRARSLIKIINSKNKTLCRYAIYDNNVVNFHIFLCFDNF